MYLAALTFFRPSCPPHLPSSWHPPKPGACAPHRASGAIDIAPRSRSWVQHFRRSQSHRNHSGGWPSPGQDTPGPEKQQMNVRYAKRPSRREICRSTGASRQPAGSRPGDPLIAHRHQGYPMRRPAAPGSAKDLARARIFMTLRILLDRYTASQPPENPGPEKHQARPRQFIWRRSEMLGAFPTFSLPLFMGKSDTSAANSSEFLAKWANPRVRDRWPTIPRSVQLLGAPSTAHQILSARMWTERIGAEELGAQKRWSRTSASRTMEAILTSMAAGMRSSEPSDVSFDQARGVSTPSTFRLLWPAMVRVECQLSAP